MKKLVRVIESFDKKTEELIGEIPLPNIPLNNIQEIFHVPEYDPMYDCWCIDEQRAGFLKQYIDINFDFKKYDYFLSCYEEDDSLWSEMDTK